MFSSKTIERGLNKVFLKDEEILGVHGILCDCKSKVLGFVKLKIEAVPFTHCIVSYLVPFSC
jgi:hypothetical protein